jgi:dipeptidase D
MILATFAKADNTHGQLEAIFTVQEETTTYGAKHVPKAIIKSKYFINLDSEHEDFIVVGSCFDNDFIGTMNVGRTASSNGTSNIGIKLDGGHSGHSGSDIHKAVLNINVELFNILKTLRKKYEFSIVEIKTIAIKNSIPNECMVMINTKRTNTNKIQKALLVQVNKMKRAMPSEDKIVFSFENLFTKTKPLKLSDSDKLINLICAANNGLNRYNFERSTTDLSTNLAIIDLQYDSVSVS